MEHIDEQRLEQDVAYRFQYLSAFMQLSADEVEAIHSAASWLAPLVPALVDAVYTKLSQYDCTWRHFLQPQSGFQGAQPQSLAELTLEHPQIQFRKQHLGRYLERLVTAPYDSKMVAYLDMVGKIHTPEAGSKSISIPLVQLNALLGYVNDALIITIYAQKLPSAAEQLTVRAFTKLLWLQNDLINRHYTTAA